MGRGRAADDGDGTRAGPDSARPDAERTDTESPDAESPDAERADSERTDAEYADPGRTDSDSPGTKRTELDRLEAERRETLQRLANLTDDYDSVVAASLDTNADDEHDPEGATIAFERSQVGALVRQARHHLAEIEAAEGRVAAGTYGTCESCGATIAAARLEARPVARTCIACASTRR